MGGGTATTSCRRVCRPRCRRRHLQTRCSDAHANPFRALTKTCGSGLPGSDVFGYYNGIEFSMQPGHLDDGVDVLPRRGGTHRSGMRASQLIQQRTTPARAQSHPGGEFPVKHFLAIPKAGDFLIIIRLHKTEILRDDLLIPHAKGLF